MKYTDVNRVKQQSSALGSLSSNAQANFTPVVAQADAAILETLMKMSISRRIGFGYEKYHGTPNPNDPTPVQLLFNAKSRSGSKLEEYWTIADLPAVPPHVVAAIALEVDNLMEMSDMFEIVHRCESPHKDSPEVVRQIVKLPWPLSNREYVMTREVYESEATKSLCVASHDTSALDKTYHRDANGTTRVVELESLVYLRYEPSFGGTRLTSVYFEDSGGSIPAWLVNFIATSVVPKAFLQLWKKCLDYMKAHSIPLLEKNALPLPAEPIPEAQNAQQPRKKACGCA